MTVHIGLLSSVVFPSGFVENLEFVKRLWMDDLSRLGLKRSVLSFLCGSFINFDCEKMWFIHSFEVEKLKFVGIL